GSVERTLGMGVRTVGWGAGVCPLHRGGVRLSRSYSRLLVRRPPMFTRVQSRAFVVLSLGLVSIGNPLHGQSVTPADTAGQDNKIELSYHVKAIKRDSSGQYTMSGTVNGERQGKATLVFGFDEGS